MIRNNHMDEVMISRLSAEQADDEQTVARAGDSGRLHNFQEADTWLSQSSRHNIEIGQDEKALALSPLSDTPLISEETVARAGDSGRLYDCQESDTWLCRSSRHNMASNYDIEIGQDTLKRESERVPCPPKTFQHKIVSSLEYFSILAHLAFFGIIGVLIRYGLEVLFEDVLSVTHEGTILYRDLPANVVGSFFMGWVGVVLKKDILLLSEPLATGLSTGLMGSITTYAAWNQKMVALLTIGNVGAALAGLLLGMAIAQMSLLSGIDSARGLKLATAKLWWDNNKHDLENVSKQPRVNLRGLTLSLAVVGFATACMWGAALALLIGGHSSQNLNILWFACLVAPPGVWIRWHLARFNGKGIGGRLKWLPVGTLLANLIGASLEAVLALLLFVVTSHNAPLLIGGLQLGFLGCLSTVSTFVAEVYTMHVGAMKVKAYTYTMLTLGLGLLLTILLYTAPALALGYVKW